MTRATTLCLLLAVGGLTTAASLAQDSDREWLAGDSHIHSHWSPAYDRTTTPPTPILGADALYPTPINAQMARRFGLSWMVTTDHGGPNHSKLNLERAYKELLLSRDQVPDVVQFYGMELNMPGMDHHTLIIPHADFESSALYDLEHRFDANEVAPADPQRGTADARVAALGYMASLARLPLVFANHPSRSAKALGVFGSSAPWEIRQSIDTAPQVYRGMEGGPGHQAAGLARDGSPRVNDEGVLTGGRGGYGNVKAPTFGGFDQMTAALGGFWDSLLGEGRSFWIVATSDSHVHYSEATRRGSDFWPGEFHKTYVFARKTYDDVLDGLRQGRMFAVAGDLITKLDLEVSGGGSRAAMGETLQASAGNRVTVRIRFHDPDGLNHGGRQPAVRRVDLIVGDVRGPLIDRHAYSNETTRVLARFDATAWKRDGEDYVIETVLPVTRNMYLRVRGTSSADLEPQPDLPGENPWTDLWFYSNPVFIRTGLETQP